VARTARPEKLGKLEEGCKRLKAIEKVMLAEARSEGLLPGPDSRSIDQRARLRDGRLQGAKRDVDTRNHLIVAHD